MGIDIILGSILGAIVSAVGSIFSLKSQQKENDKNRQYNLMLAQTQNRMNVNQWQRENDYNSPTAQMARYRKAGMNPNLAYGQPTLSASSPTMTTGSSSSPTDMSAISKAFDSVGGAARSFGQYQQVALDMERQQAEIDAIRAQTENTKANTVKTGEETKSLTIDNMYKAAREQSALDYQGVQIKLGESTLRLNDKQMEKMQADIEKVAVDIDSVKQAIDESKSRIALQNVQRESQFAAMIRDNNKAQAELEQVYLQNKELLTRININRQTFDEMVMTQYARALGLELDNQNKGLQGELLHKQGINVDYNNKIISVDASYNEQIAKEFNEGKTGATLAISIGSAIKRISPFL